MISAGSSYSIVHTMSSTSAALRVLTNEPVVVFYMGSWTAFSLIGLTIAYIDVLDVLGPPMPV